VRLDQSIVIAAPAPRVLQAFFDPKALAVWWQAHRSVTTPRTLGVYAVEWTRTDFRDPILGALGGVFYGTVVQFHPTQGFFVSDAYWLPPEGDPVGPMALDVGCAPVRAPGGETSTILRVVQSGYDEGPRWRRYYEVVSSGWERALVSLRQYLEQGHG
jgi:hypothetical protein